jgi:hypothetical protein
MGSSLIEDHDQKDKIFREFLSDHDNEIDTGNVNYTVGGFGQKRPMSTQANFESAESRKNQRLEKQKQVQTPALDVEPFNAGPIDSSAHQINSSLNQINSSANQNNSSARQIRAPERRNISMSMWQSIFFGSAIVP